MSGGEGFGGAEEAYDPKDPQSKTDTFADYLARRNAENAYEAPSAPEESTRDPEESTRDPDAVVPTVRERLAQMLRPGRRKQILPS